MEYLFVYDESIHPQFTDLIPNYGVVDTYKIPGTSIIKVKLSESFPFPTMVPIKFLNYRQYDVKLLCDIFSHMSHYENIKCEIDRNVYSFMISDDDLLYVQNHEFAEYYNVLQMVADKRFVSHNPISLLVDGVERVMSFDIFVTRGDGSEARNKVKKLKKEGYFYCDFGYIDQNVGFFINLFDADIISKGGSYFILSRKYSYSFFKRNYERIMKGLIPIVRYGATTISEIANFIVGYINSISNHDEALIYYKKKDMFTIDDNGMISFLCHSSDFHDHIIGNIDDAPYMFRIFKSYDEAIKYRYQISDVRSFMFEFRGDIYVCHNEAEYKECDENKLRSELMSMYDLISDIEPISLISLDEISLKDLCNIVVTPSKHPLLESNFELLPSPKRDPIGRSYFGFLIQAGMNHAGYYTYGPLKGIIDFIPETKYPSRNIDIDIFCTSFSGISQIHILTYPSVSIIYIDNNNEYKFCQLIATALKNQYIVSDYDRITNYIYGYDGISMILLPEDNIIEFLESL